MGPQTFAVCLLLCVVRTSDSSSQTIFIQTGQSLLLNVTEEIQSGDLFFWKFNRTKNIVKLSNDKITKFGIYKERVDFFKQNHSLVLKNVQLSDNGIYTAVVSQEEDETLSKYDVTVQDPVSPVSLSLVSRSNSSDSCNFTVSCKTNDSTIISNNYTFACNRSTCVKLHPFTPDPAPSLHLYLSDLSIICIHSNHVSKENDTKEIREACPPFGEKDTSDFKESAGVNDAVIGGVAGAAALCVIGFIAGFVAYRGKTRGQRVTMENSVYELPKERSTGTAPDRDVAMTERQDTSTIYSEVQPHTAPVPAPATAPGQKPESVYATVNKPKTPDLLQSAA